MIALWGNAGDPPLAAIAAALERLRGPFVHLSQTVQIARRWSEAGEAVVRAGGRELSLAEISALYLRPAFGADALRDPFGVAATLLAWADTTPALVVNRPSAAAPNLSKPLQAQLIAAAGLQVPQTLLTTDAERVRAFAAEHGTLVYKSISGNRSIVRRLDQRRLDELQDIATCPTQFQRYIRGEDLRVHVVGDGVHAVSVVSEADDYRYAGPNQAPRATPVTVDEELAARLRAMTRAMGLSLAGVDLRRTNAGEIFCLEVNPSPAFTYYERLAGVDLSTPIARLLLQASRR